MITGKMVGRVTYVGALVAVVCAAGFAGCSGGGGGDSGGPSSGGPASDEVAFHGEMDALPSFDGDTGLLPAASPVQVQLTFSAAGKATADASAIGSGSNDTPVMTGKPGSGKYALDVHFKLTGRLKIDLTGIPKYDGPIPGLDAIDIPVGGSAAFDPFAIGKATAVKAPIPETKLPPIPLPGGIPGQLILTVVEGSEIDSELSGLCASVTKGSPPTGHYVAQTKTGGTLKIQPTILIKNPLGKDKTFDVPAFTVPVPALMRALDLGSKPLGLGGTPPAGGDVASSASCDGVQPTDAGPMPGEDGGPTPGDGSTPGDDGGPPGDDAGGGDATSSDDGGGPPPIEDVLDSLILDLAFDEGSGSSASDGSPAHHDGTLAGGTDWIPGRRGNALHFDGVDGAVKVGDLGPASAWTIMAWVRSEDVVDTRCLLDANVDDFALGPRLSQSSNGGGIVDLDLGNDDMLLASLVSGEWHQVAVTFDGSVALLYFDGDEQWTHTAVGPASFGSFVVGNGNGNGGSNPTSFRGGLDEVRVYSRALTSEEVGRVYVVYSAP